MADAFLLSISYFLAQSILWSMHILKNYILLFILIIALDFFISTAQEKTGGFKTLIKIEDAFNKGNVDEISQFIGDKTYFSFTSDLSGYFSYSQIYSMLKDYFEVYKPIKFRFTSKNTEAESPFGWGELIYIKKGVKDSHKIFISLQQSGTDFYISQFSIN